jgi:hypothetical protein
MLCCFISTGPEKMNKLPLNANREAIITAVEAWVDLLVAKKYQAALDFIYPIPYPEWDAQYLETWIRNYGHDQPLKNGRVVEITPRNQAKGEQYNKDFEVDEPQIDETTGLTVIGMVLYDVPLDGEWSDLTIQFNVCKFEKGLVLDMNGFHVM